MEVTTCYVVFEEKGQNVITCSTLLLVALWALDAADLMAGLVYEGLGL